MAAIDPEPEVRRAPQQALSVDDLAPVVREALRAAWAEARAAHADLDVPVEAYVAEVLRLWARGQGRAGLPIDAGPSVGDVERLHHADVYLARACNRLVEAAWLTVVSTYRAALVRLVRKQAPGANSEAVVQEMLADAALPPSRGPEATLMGTYEGTGSLWGWMATIAVRRARRERPAREVRMIEPERVAHPTTATPDESDLDMEAFGDGLRRAWKCLEPIESLAICWKYQDGRSQREIASLLAVSPPTVTRLLQRAVAKLRGQLTEHAEALRHGSNDLWARFDALLSGQLAAAAASEPDEGEIHDPA